MAEPEAKAVRKNRTLNARIEEIEEMYGREPTAFEHRSLAELPLKENGGKVKELYDTSANSRRIRELLEESERNRDVSLLEEAGELLTFQATRSPFAVEPEAEVEEVKFFSTSTSYPERLLCYSPPRRGRTPAPTPSPPSTTTPLHMNQPSAFRSKLVGVSYRPILPPLPTVLPQSKPNHHSQHNLPLRHAVTPIQYPGGNFGGSLAGAPHVLPNYSGWHQAPPPQYYSSTAPSAYSLSNGPANFNNFRPLPYHTSRMPMSNQSGMTGFAPPQSPAFVSLNHRTTPNTNPYSTYQPTTVPPGNLSKSNGPGMPMDHHCSMDSFAPPQTPVILPLNYPNPPNVNESASYQSAGILPRSQTIPTGLAAALPSATVLPNLQPNLNSHSPGDPQPFHIDPQDTKNSTNQPISQQPPPMGASKPKSNSRVPLPAGKKHDRNKYAEDELEQATDEKIALSTKKKGKKK